jgi:hypothetical protein
MKYKLSLFTIILITIFFYSCSSSNEKNINKDSVAAKVTPATVLDTSNQIIDSTILLNIKSLHEFSDTIVKDSFYLTLIGKTILNGRVIFKIINKDGQEIYKETFSAFDLLGDEASLISTDKNKADTITVRMNRFFDEKCFIKPAIKIIPEFDSDFSDKNIWKEINADKTSIGFLYSYGYEGVFAIAYSKLKRKAVQYFWSD